MTHTNRYEFMLVPCLFISCADEHALEALVTRCKRFKDVSNTLETRLSNTQDAEDAMWKFSGRYKFVLITLQRRREDVVNFPQRSLTSNNVLSTCP